jgi:hypothetical protein
VGPDITEAGKVHVDEAEAELELGNEDDAYESEPKLKLELDTLVDALRPFNRRDHDRDLVVSLFSDFLPLPK